MVKPMIFSATHTLNYDYLEFSNKDDELVKRPIDKMGDVLTTNKCRKNCNHETHNGFGIPSNTVVKTGKHRKYKTNRCLQCIYDHVEIQNKNKILDAQRIFHRQQQDAIFRVIPE